MNEKLLFGLKEIPREIQRLEDGLKINNWTLTSVAGIVWLMFAIKSPFNKPEHCGLVVWTFDIVCS